ncbi:MAG: hypothetical protein RIR76_3036 [Verrucomicrobiota bacterium]|jgi:alcohol dehydrogenase|nr:iron-containing alcohol dehydrogenase [Opitutaceae bacterium]
MPEAFASRPAPRLIFGPGKLRELPEAVRGLGGTAVFVVSDPGVARAGHLDAALRLLADAGLPAAAFAESRENPTESDTATCRDAAHAHRFDCIVAIGGGSSLDTAKACNFLLTNGGAMRDYHGYGKASRPLLPLIAIPTTAGTGSETQSYALISRDGSHEKMACGDPKALPAVAILDPDLTSTLPHGAALLSGVDALTHAIESAVCTKANPVSSGHAEEAFRHIAAAIDRVVDGRPTADDRAHMLLGAALAGSAIENSMLGAAHASANPLTARLGIVHGRAVATMLPHVMRFNATVPAAAAGYDRLDSRLRGLGVTDLSLQAWIEALVQRCHFPALDPAADFALLAEDATRQWTGKFNPRPLQREDFISLYRRAASVET